MGDAHIRFLKRCSWIAFVFETIIHLFEVECLNQGVPMMTMGDEYAHTKGGNNDTYCHDNAV